MNLRATLCIALLGGLGTSAAAFAVQEARALPLGDTEITAADLERHVRYLASDEMRGRRVGSEELNLAAKGLAAQLESFGLEPAGDAGTFLQEMFFEVAEYEDFPELSLAAAEGSARAVPYSEGFRVRQIGASGSFTLVVVTEDVAPEESWDANTALYFPDMSSSKLKSWLRKQGLEDDPGVGLLIGESRRAGKPASRLPRKTTRLKSTGDDSAVKTSWIEVAPEWQEWLAQKTEVRVELDLHHRRELLPSYNVIARLPGRGTAEHPELAQQAIVVSAHYDHIGVRSQGEDSDAQEFDSVYNGADDDASGVAGVMEIAQRFAADGPQARELLFLLATAEEIGIVGTQFYIDQPSTPLERTVANLNFEMIGRPDEKAGGPGRLWLSGHDRTTLMETYLKQGIQIVADPYPEQNFFERSDNIVFCRRGIVGQTFSSYNMHKDYHEVTDEADTLDFEHMQAATRAGFEAVRLVADGTITPSWLEGRQPKQRTR